VPKPFDIRERAFLFSCELIRAFPAQRPLEPPAWRVWSQAIAAGTSVGAHLEEADAASSRTHFISLNRGALREAREARYWLRLILATKLRNHERVPSLAEEADQLVRIVSAIVKRASRQAGDTERSS
jgi:four helix bundle protein